MNHRPQSDSRFRAVGAKYLQNQIAVAQEGEGRNPDAVHLAKARCE